MIEARHTPGSLYYQDLQPGMRGSDGPYVVDEREMLEFAARWDPLPIHTAGAPGGTEAHGSVIAPGTYTLAVKQHLLARNCPWGKAVIGAVEHDKLRFLKAVHPGDALTLHWEVRESRPSRSKPDRGITTFYMYLDRPGGDKVLEYLDIIMLARRRP